MSDPTQAIPPVAGPGAGDAPPAPPPSDPPTGGPGGGGPDDPGTGGGDRRKIAIAVVVGLIVLALLVLLFVALSGDDEDEDIDSDAATTTTQPTTTSSSSTTTGSTTTTTVDPTTTTTGSSTTTTTSSTTTTTTTTTTTPPPTIDPARCNGDAPPDDPEPVAEVFYEAWTIDDVGCAEEIGSDDAIETLFALDGSDADWSSEGCEPNDDVEPAVIECEFRYVGGAAFFEMVFSALDGWVVDGVRFETD